MVKAMHGQGWVGGVLRSSVLSSLARPGRIGDRRGKVEQSTLRQGKVLLWYGGAVSGCAGWATVERGFVWFGKALSWQGGVEQSEVRYGKLSSWPGEALFGVVGFIGALYSKVRSFCGIVRSVEALHCMVKSCPVKHCMVSHAKALFWLSGVLHSIAWRGSVGRCLVRYAKALLMHGMARHRTVGSGFARLCAAGQALVSSRFGEALLSQVWRGPVLQGPVRLGLHEYEGD